MSEILRQTPITYTTEITEDQLRKDRNLSILAFAGSAGVLILGLIVSQVSAGHEMLQEITTITNIASTVAAGGSLAVFGGSELLIRDCNQKN
jgi:hypothetical protein